MYIPWSVNIHGIYMVYTWYMRSSGFQMLARVTWYLPVFSIVLVYMEYPGYYDKPIIYRETIYLRYIPGIYPPQADKSFP